MRISPIWLREFVNIKVSDHQLADDLTLAGVAVESVKQIGGQTLFEMEIGTNRPDAMCHYGVARECSAIYDIDLKPIVPKLPKGKAAAKAFPIEIHDKEGCKRYTARVICNVKIGPSPQKMLDRLKIDDHGGVSNAVDASNYTLMEMGHPTHAFDLDKLEGGRIIVRRARAGETLKTLDGVDRKLEAEDLVIADASKPVALAGIMGGFETAISTATKNILIESAWFDPATVRKTARRLGMHTDASHIFERGADWGATPLACNRVAELILSSAGGELEGEPVDAIAGHVPRYSLILRRPEILRLLGQDIPETEITRMLTRLGFVLKMVKGEEIMKRLTEGMPQGSMAVVLPQPGSIPSNAKGGDYEEKIRKYTADLLKQLGGQTCWIVDLPTWRLDIEREIDLIEEIARIYGYNKFPNTLPSFSGGVVELPGAAKESRLRNELLALGYDEAVSSTFISPADAQAFSNRQTVMLANPLSAEQSVMRSSLVPGMLGMIAWNLNRGASDVRLFESGHIFELAEVGSKNDKSEERKMLSVGATGNALDQDVHTKARPYTFFDLKGNVETLLAGFELGKLQLDTGAASYYHPGRSAQFKAGGQVIAQFGQIHPDVATARKLRQEVYLAEIFLDRLLNFELRVPRYEPLSRFPAVGRDFSFVFGDNINFAQISSTVHALNIAELQSFVPVEIFRGGAVPSGSYSILLRAEFQSPDRTLRDDEVAQWSAEIVKALEAMGGSLRTS
jgi:phenylalanyl-tRNA synthetase beta chain